MGLTVNRRQFATAVATSFAATVLPAAENPPSPKTRTILTGSISSQKTKTSLLAKGAWKPFPTAAERTLWDNLPADLRTKATEASAKNLKAVWPALPVTLLLDYNRTGARTPFESPSFARRKMLADLVVGECIEGKGRFLDDIATGIWAICEESWWGSPAHLSAQKGGAGLPNPQDEVVELFGGETAGLLAWTDYLLGPQLDSVSQTLRQRLFLEVNRRILTPALERDDYGWMGLKNKSPVNNWNPWICSNWLTAALLLESNPTRRQDAVWKIMTCLDRFFSSYFDDGGCDEGPSYWGRAGASLFDCLWQLHSVSNGVIDVFKEPLVASIGAYIYKAHVAGDYYINFADAPAIVHSPGDVIFRFGQAVGDSKLQAFGAWCESETKSSRDGSLLRRLPAIFDEAKIGAAPKGDPLARDIWFPGMQVAAARIQEGNVKGLYLAAQGGHNAESHNHNDVGNFIVYANGLPYIVDLGPETYSAKTFSKDRYSIWVMQSAYHNLPTINSVMQSAGRQFQATGVSHEATDTTATFDLNIEQAYPKEAGVKSWRRSLTLDRAKNELALLDNWTLSRDLGPNSGKIEWTFMTPCRATNPTAGEVLLQRLELGSPQLRIVYEPTLVTAAIERIPLTDARLKSSWGTSITRVLLKMPQAAGEGKFDVRIVQS